MTRSRESSRVDFLILTALDEERRAILAALPKPVKRLKQAQGDIRIYYEARVALAGRRSYRVVVASVSAMGRVKAAVATANALQRWTPRAVLVVGIAGGVGSQKVALGDVLIADQIVDFELQKLRKPAQGPRFQVYTTAARLLESAHHLHSRWQPGQRSRPKAGTSDVHFGPVATGDKVVALERFLAQLLKAWPRLLGVEMEAGGVAAACFESEPRPEFLMIRGVSDLADEKKDTRAVQQWRRFACTVAARYALGLIRSAPLPPPAAARQRPSQAVARTDPPSAPKLDRRQEGLSISSWYGFMLTRGTDPYPMESLSATNLRTDKTLDDVTVELRLPARIAFVRSGEMIGEDKPVFGRVTLSIARPLHPGTSVSIGHVREYFDFSNFMAGVYGATVNRDAVEWTVSARDEPAVSGEINIASLRVSTKPT